MCRPQLMPPEVMDDDTMLEPTHPDLSFAVVAGPAHAAFGTQADQYVASAARPAARARPDPTDGRCRSSVDHRHATETASLEPAPTRSGRNLTGVLATPRARRSSAHCSAKPARVSKKRGRSARSTGPREMARIDGLGPNQLNRHVSDSVMRPNPPIRVGKQMNTPQAIAAGGRLCRPEGQVTFAVAYQEGGGRWGNHGFPHP